MTRLILVRHAQSESNEAKFYAAQTNVNLTELGRAQAEETAHFLADYPIDIAYSSDYVRVIQRRQGIEISAPEEIAFRNGWISREELMESADHFGKSPYGEHLRRVAEGKLFG